MSDQNVNKKEKVIVSPWLVEDLSSPMSTSLTSLSSSSTILGCVPPKSLRWGERNTRSFSHENILSNSLPILHHKNSGSSSTVVATTTKKATTSRTIATQTSQGELERNDNVNQCRLRRSSFTDWQRMGQELRHIADDLRRSTNSLDSTSSTESLRHFFYSNILHKKIATRNHSTNDVRQPRHFSFGATTSNENLFKKK